MNFRRRLLASLSLMIVVTVLAIGWIISLRTKQVFEAADTARTDALVRQFQQEFQKRGDDVLRRGEAIAQNEASGRMAFDVSQGVDTAAYFSEAGAQAQAHQLDFLEYLKADGSIISSAQWPARFGYKEAIPREVSGPAFLKREELPDGSALGLVAVRQVKVGDQPLYVV